MSVTQRLMAPGNWSLRFKENCPRSVYSVPNYFEHIVVTATKLQPITSFSDTNILANAIYTGVIHTKPDHLSLEGAGPEFWMATPDGASQWIDVATRYSSGALALSAWVDTYIGATTTFTAIQAGTLNDSGLSSAPAGTTIPGPIAVREAIDALCLLVGAEWRVTPRMKLDTGLASNLFVTTPTVVVTRHEEGQEGSYRGLAGTELTAAGDVQQYANLAIAYDAAGNQYSSLVTAVYTDFYGNALNMMRVVDAGAVTTSGDLSAAATRAAATLAVQRQNITLSSDTYSVGRFVQPGDYVYVWDQEAGLIDQAIQTPYRGELITPIKLRVYGLTWPFAQGMGVYHRTNAGVYTDLSDQIEWETGAVEWEVGATAREIDTSRTLVRQTGGAYLGANPVVAARTAGFGTTAPTGTGVDGQEFWDSTNERLYRSDGVGWIIMAEPDVSFASTVTSNTGTITTASLSLHYHRVDGWLGFYGDIVVTTNGTGATYVNFTLPIAVVAGDTYAGAGRNTTTGNMLQVFPGGTGMIVLTYNNAYPVGASGTMAISGRYRMTTRYS